MTYNKTVLIILVLTINACALSNKTYLRNDTGHNLKISIKGEQKNLHWERIEHKVVEVPINTICTISTDNFYDNYFYIENMETGISTNISQLTKGPYLYTLEKDDDKQVLRIEKAKHIPKSLKKLKQDTCIPPEE